MSTAVNDRTCVNIVVAERHSTIKGLRGPHGVTSREVSGSRWMSLLARPKSTQCLRVTTINDCGKHAPVYMRDAQSPGFMRVVRLGAFTGAENTPPEDPGLHLSAPPRPGKLRAPTPRGYIIPAVDRWEKGYISRLYVLEGRTKPIQASTFAQCVSHEASPHPQNRHRRSQRYRIWWHGHLCVLWSC